jgi:hypothetical protein
MSGSRSANRARCRSPQPRTDRERNTGATRTRSRPHPSPSPDRVRARPVLPQGLAAPFSGVETPAFTGVSRRLRTVGYGTKRENDASTRGKSADHVHGPFVQIALPTCRVPNSCLATESVFFSFFMHN